MAEIVQLDLQPSTLLEIEKEVSEQLDHSGRAVAVFVLLLKIQTEEEEG